MRLENKMNKWLKFILKIMPFLPIIFNIFAFIGSDVAPFFALNLHDDVGINTDNWVGAIDYISYFILNSINELITIPDFLSEFNTFVVGLFGWSGPNGTEPVIWILCLFEWFLTIDIFDLMFSAFRFIIDICRSWLDSFYDKNKGGYK